MIIWSLGLFFYIYQNVIELERYFDLRRKFMYFSPSFLQNTLYIVVAVLIVFILTVIIYKIKHNIKIWDKSMTLAIVVLLNTLYSILGGFINLPYELSSVVTGGLSLVAFGYIVVIIWDLHKQRKISEK